MEKEKEKQNMISRFLQGWGQLFGGSKNAPQPKPFPGDRFFYPEELAYLSKTGEPLSQIEKWAVEAGKKAYIESFGSTARPGFNHVQWQGGIMSSYVKGLPVADNETEQVAKLKELKAQNYILPDNQLNIIRKYEARDILGRYFKTNNGDIYHVEGLDTGDNKEESTLSLIKYTPTDISGKKESIGFEKFKNDIQTVFHPLSSREEAAFNDRLADAREAKIQYEMIGRTVLDSPIAITEGKIVIEQQKAYGVENGMFIPESWGIIHGGTQIALKGHSDTNEDKTLVIDHMNACNYKALLDVVYDGVYRQRDSKLSAALVETLGNKLPNGETFYKSPRSIALFHTDKGVDIDSILVDKQGELFALSSNHHVELSKNDLQKMKNNLVINGIIEHKELEKELIVPLMKDYVDSMTTGEDIHSGNIDKLPVNTRIKSLCRQEWQLEQAYNQYANHPADEDFANQYKAEWNAASLAYTLELKRLVDAYRINPGKVDLEKKARFDRLNKLLHFTPKPFNMEQDHSLDASNKVTKEEQRPANDEQVKSKKEVETHIHPAETPTTASEERVNIEDAEVSDSDEYGRWHSPDIKQREVYLQYGKLLSEKLALQQTYEKLPLTNNRRSQPTSLDKKEYQGIHAFVLALNTEKNGFFMPVYLTEEDLKSKKLLVKKEASCFPLIEKRGIVNVYNIEQTNYSFRYPQEYASLKNELLSEEQENKKENRLPRLLQPENWRSAIIQDGKPNLASYNSKEDVIHIGRQDQYDKEDDFYRDLAEGLIRSTRQKEARNTKYNALVKEELISLVGANMLGQENRFNVTIPQQSAIWKKRLRNDPDYARDVLVSASISQTLVESRISGIKPQLGNEIDMRSATPINIDSDGNGIVDSQENLVADQKQGSNENQEQQAEDSVSHHVRHGRR